MIGVDVGSLFKESFWLFYDTGSFMSNVGFSRVKAEFAYENLGRFKGN